jgi:tryptophan-rich sensory protein
MKNQLWKTYGFWIGLSEAVGIVSGLLSRNGMVIFRQTATQPVLSPPPILFPIVWTVLYALMGIGAARIYLAPPSAERSKSLNLFIAQLTVNFFWSLLFFNAKAYGFALLWLILLFLLVLWMTLAYHKIDRWAALLQVPYLLWLSFAAYLNWAVWQLNP